MYCGRNPDDGNFVIHKTERLDLMQIIKERSEK